MSEEQIININDDPATVELTINEWNGLLDALNRPYATPNIILVGYINRFAQQLEPQAMKLIEIKKAMEAATKNATCKPIENQQWATC